MKVKPKVQKCGQSSLNYLILSLSKDEALAAWPEPAELVLSVRSAASQGSTIMASRLLRIALVLFAVALATGTLAACGKRQGELEPPKDTAKQYPRQYPAW